MEPNSNPASNPPYDRFAQTILAISDACSHALTTLNAVTSAKRTDILHMIGGHESRDVASPAPAQMLGRLDGGLVGDPAGDDPATMLREAVVLAVTMAIQNAVAASQNLDVLAQAILTQEAARVLALRVGGEQP